MLRSYKDPARRDAIVHLPNLIVTFPVMLTGQLLNYLSFWKPVGGNNAQSPLANPPAGPISTSRPNIVFILTDDQDLHLNSLDYMPLTQKHLVDQGTFYKRHYCTIAVCCPSRVSLWTGKTGENRFHQHFGAVLIVGYCST